MIHRAVSPLHKIEIAFWDSYDQVLSKNVTLRRAIRELTTLARKQHPVWMLFVFAVCAVSGLTFGYVIGSIFH